MTHLRYKDYQGSVTFVDGTLLIQILHIDDLITTECQSAPDAQQAFEELVDDYIQTCAELNKSPSKPFKGSFNVRVTPALHRSIAMHAAESGDSLNSYVQQALQEKVDRAASSRKLAAMNYRMIFESHYTEDWDYVSLQTKKGSENPVLRTSASWLYATPSRMRN